jgi:hypothetical protein
MAVRFGRVSFKVKGMSFRPGYPMFVFDLSTMVEEARMATIQATATWADIAAAVAEFPAFVVRDQNNSHDPNAIEVHIPALGRRGFVGFVPKELAVRWAPRMDDGEMPEAFVDSRIHPGHLDNPGITLWLIWHRPECPRFEVPARKLGLACTCPVDNPQRPERGTPANERN